MKNSNVNIHGDRTEPCSLNRGCSNREGKSSRKPSTYSYCFQVCSRGFLSEKGKREDRIRTRGNIHNFFTNVNYIIDDF